MLHLEGNGTPRQLGSSVLQSPLAGVSDRIFRSLGSLERARILSTEEALTCLSAVRFGVEQGLIPDISLGKVNTALLLAQPAHLQRLCSETLSTDERDQRRATLMRKVLGRD